MKPEDPLGHLTLGGVKPQAVADVDAPDDQYLAVQFDLAGRLRGKETLPGWNPTRLQRAPKCSGESPGGSCHDVVQRGGVRFVGSRIHSVVLGNF